MGNLYTETMLKKLKKPDLLKIAGDNEIEIKEGATNPEIIALILEKGCPVVDESAAPVSEADIPKFTKGQILASRWFAHRRDVLSVLLSDDEEYSHGEVDALLIEFMKGQVK